MSEILDVDLLAFERGSADQRRAVVDGVRRSLATGFVITRHDLPEESLPHLEGYRGSRPVRIGNGAAGQLQLDIYGELLDSVYLYNKYGEPISYGLWRNMVHLVDWVCRHWHEPDEGIWEVRGGRKEFVHSRLMCWVAVDRAMRIARDRSFPAPLA